jgi:hypothetical protein
MSIGTIYPTTVQYVYRTYLPLICVASDRFSSTVFIHGGGGGLLHNVTTAIYLGQTITVYVY